MSEHWMLRSSFLRIGKRRQGARLLAEPGRPDPYYVVDNYNNTLLGCDLTLEQAQKVLESYRNSPNYQCRVTVYR